MISKIDTTPANAFSPINTLPIGQSSEIRIVSDANSAITLSLGVLSTINVGIGLKGEIK